MSLIEVEIRLYLGLHEYLPPGPDEEGYARRIKIEQGTPVGEVLDGLGIPRDDTILIMVNGAPADRDSIPQPGDVLVALPPLFGG